MIVNKNYENCEEKYCADTELETHLLAAFFLMRGLLLGEVETTDLRSWQEKKQRKRGKDRNKAEIDAERVERMIKYCQKNKISYEGAIPTPDEAAQPVDLGDFSM
jgi:hypothetical protein